MNTKRLFWCSVQGQATFLHRQCSNFSNPRNTQGRLFAHEMCSSINAVRLPASRLQALFNVHSMNLTASWNDMPGTLKCGHFYSFQQRRHLLIFSETILEKQAFAVHKKSKLRITRELEVFFVTDWFLTPQCGKIKTDIIRAPRRGLSKKNSCLMSPLKSKLNTLTGTAVCLNWLLVTALYFDL